MYACGLCEMYDVRVIQICNKINDYDKHKKINLDYDKMKTNRKQKAYEECK